MPDVIQQAFQNSPVLLQWFSWGVIVAFLITLVATVWIFADAQRTNRDATILKSVGAVACVLAVPALLARLHAGFAFEMKDSLALVAYLSAIAAAIAIVAVIAQTLTRESAVATCPICGQPQQPSWTQCPFHPAPLPLATPVPLTPIIAVAPQVPLGASSPPVRTPGKETMVFDSPEGKVPMSPASGGPSVPAKGTVILKRQQTAPALAFLVIVSGPYTNTTLPLSDGVTRIGRSGRMNDHAIDDDAVSEQHLSIRCHDGEFVATDLDSSNGTTVNGKRIDKQALAGNDVIVIGNTKLVFMKVPELAPKTDE